MIDTPIEWGPFQGPNADDIRISRPLVMHTPAGFYVGQVCEDRTGFGEPYARLTDYVATKAEAVSMLTYMQEGV